MSKCLTLENHGSVKPNEIIEEKKFVDFGEDNAFSTSIQTLSADKCANSSDWPIFLILSLVESSKLKSDR